MKLPFFFSRIGQKEFFEKKKIQELFEIIHIIGAFII